MAEPENHTLRVLRDIRGAIQAVDTKIQALDAKVDRHHAENAERFQSLRQAINGESVLGRYAAAEVEERLTVIEQRLAALEKRG